LERFEHRYHRPDQRSFDQAPAGPAPPRVRGRLPPAAGQAVRRPLRHPPRLAGARVDPAVPLVRRRAALSKVGRQLAGATGAVYRVAVPHKRREQFALVVKFSRFAQEALVSIAPDEVMDWEERDRIAASEFLSPFEEFAHLERLRAAAGCRIPTKAPLAIYSPATRYLDWQLGRRSHRRWWYDRVLGEDQAAQPEGARVRADYAWERMYILCSVSILLYRWIDGIDAETAHQQGYLTEPELWQLSGDARRDLRGLGWDVLDHKPRHLIVRPCPRSGGLVSRRRRTLWALVDYELLVPYPAAAARPCARPSRRPKRRPTNHPVTRPFPTYERRAHTQPLAGSHRRPDRPGQPRRRVYLERVPDPAAGRLPRLVGGPGHPAGPNRHRDLRAGRDLRRADTGPARPAARRHHRRGGVGDGADPRGADGQLLRGGGPVLAGGHLRRARRHRHRHGLRVPHRDLREVVPGPARPDHRAGGGGLRGRRLLLRTAGAGADHGRFLPALRDRALSAAPGRDLRHLHRPRIHLSW
jgi:hypothetical protein